MSKYILANARLFAGSADLTGASNKITLGAMREEKDVTTFASVDASGNLWKEVIGGLGSASLDASGFWEATDASKVDDETWADMGAVIPITVVPGTTANAGDVAYLTQALRSEYQLGGAVGDVAPWTAKASGAWPLARGVVANPPGTARTSTATGTGFQLGAVAAGQSLYCTLHVLSVAGTSTPTITVQVSSSVDNTFGAPTTQASFTAATAIGGQTVRVAGPITDSWFKVKWTISGTSPSFLFMSALGIA